MIRCPDNVAPERREVRGGEFSIGRGRDNEWGNDARMPQSGSLLDVSNSPILPADFDPLAPNQEPFAGTQPDHAPALESAFRPPQPVAIIPDDWDVDSPAAPRPPTARPTH